MRARITARAKYVTVRQRADGSRPIPGAIDRDEVSDVAVVTAVAIPNKTTVAKRDFYSRWMTDVISSTELDANDHPIVHAAQSIMLKATGGYTGAYTDGNAWMVRAIPNRINSRSSSTEGNNVTTASSTVTETRSRPCLQRRDHRHQSDQRWARRGNPGIDCSMLRRCLSPAGRPSLQLEEGPGDLVFSNAWPRPADRAATGRDSSTDARSSKVPTTSIRSWYFEPGRTAPKRARGRQLLVLKNTELRDRRRSGHDGGSRLDGDGNRRSPIFFSDNPSSVQRYHDRTRSISYRLKCQ